MANSRLPGFLHFLDPWVAPRTPGPMGHNDHGDPMVCSMLGDSPGPLGFGDWADPTLLPSSQANSGAAKSESGVPLALPVSGQVPAKQVAAVPGVDVDALKTLFDGADDAYLQQVASELSSDPVAFGLDTPLRRAHFFAQLREEAGQELDRTDEDLRYSGAALKSLFSYYKNHPTEADEDAYAKDAKGKVVRAADQQKIANKAYAGRNGNGNVASGDGWAYRGRGLIQLTGRGNYAAISKRYAKVYAGTSVDFETTPGLVSEFPYSLRAAVCFWLEHGCPGLADKGSKPADVDRITAVVNAATKSYEERRAHFLKAWKAFQQ
jgi:putative chitinase